MRFLKISTLITIVAWTISGNLFAQNSSDHISGVMNCNAPVNVGRLLLEGVKLGAIKMVKFDEFGTKPREIRVGDIRIRQNDFWGEEWSEGMTYYMGDAVQYEGQVYECLVDNNTGNTPGKSDSWQLFEEVWSEIDDVNSFTVEKNESSEPTYFHLYYQLLGDPGEESTYLASFDANEVIKYLNTQGILWYQTDGLGHLAGSIFLDIPNDIFLQSAKLSGINISAKDISFEGRSDKWWATSRNFALGENDKFRFIFYDDSAMWEVPARDYVKLGVEGSTPFILLGNAMASGKAFDMDISIDEIQIIKKISTSITEFFPALDILYLLGNNQKQKTPVALTDVSVADWSDFTETIIEGTRKGKWTAYTSEFLDKKMSARDFDLRLIINEDEAVDLAFGFDQWNKTVTYYFDDNVLYAGILYKSLKENNVNHIPTQWPEYWDEVIIKNEYFYPDELRNVKVRSRLVFDNSGKILSITPEAFSLEVPGNYVLTGLSKEIAWFKLSDFGKSDNAAFNRILDKIKSHNFYAEMVSYEPLKASQ